MKKSIAVAGSILVDKINSVGIYPASGELTKILKVSQAVGGCVPNVAIDLKRIDPSLTVKASGKVGDDAEGRFVIDTMAQNGIDTSAVRLSSERTSFTEVISVIGGQRTFFTYAGASSDYGRDDIDFDALDTEMLHLGYFLLLDKIDSGDGIEILKEAKRRGIKTSIDLVSENSDRYTLVLPCLEFTDNVIINEVEAGKLTGTEPTKENLREIAEKLFAYGVSERVIIHTPDLGVCYSKDGFTVSPSYEVPQNMIKGTTGAGDAFCSGALLGIYRGLNDSDIMELATACAVASLTEADAIGGMRHESEILKLCKDLGRKCYACKFE